MTNPPIQLNSQIRKLNTLLLKTPAKQLQNLLPHYLHPLFFHHIPFLNLPQQHHHHFPQLLQHQPIQLLYLQKLPPQTIQHSNLTHQFIDHLLPQSTKTILPHQKQIK
ncbi:arginine deiminase family protein, partial [Staphylococcus epidermidis]|uniref:arginine deiminase family protein n=1 Tax=Staphylococcus epidermidis TaxID=1282 RepID=UPI0037D9A453